MLLNNFFHENTVIARFQVKHIVSLSKYNNKLLENVKFAKEASVNHW